MSDEKYIADIGEQGSEGLGKLDYCFNLTTKEFLLSVGLKQAKSILDIGCGSGVMTCWMAEQIGNNGKIIAIENDSNQLNAAKHNAESKSINNIEFKLYSAYDQQGNSWLAIDPKGMVGEMAFEVAAFDLIDKDEMKNIDALSEKITDRVSQLSKKLNLDHNRLLSWIFLRIIISVQWFIEDNGDPGDMLALAKPIYSMLRK
jgi:FkbM family methyltransferase